MPLTYNGESFTVVESAAVRAERHDWFELSGEATAEYRLTELDQTAPKGRYRWRVEDDVMVLQQQVEAATSTNEAVWKTYLSIDRDGITLDTLNDDQSVLLQVMLQYLQEMREMMEAALESGEEAGNG